MNYFSESDFQTRCASLGHSGFPGQGARRGFETSGPLILERRSRNSWIPNHLSTLRQKSLHEEYSKFTSLSFHRLERKCISIPNRSSLFHPYVYDSLQPVHTRVFSAAVAEWSTNEALAPDMCDPGCLSFTPRVPRHPNPGCSTLSALTELTWVLLQCGLRAWSCF